MKTSTCAAVVAAMVVEGAVFAAFWPAQKNRPEAPSAPKEQKVPDHSAETIKALRLHVAALEKQLAEKNEAPAAEKIEETETPRAPEAVREEGGRRERRGPSLADMRAWGENMRQNDPEGYARMTNHFARMRERRARENAETRDFLASVNTDNMSPESLKVHNEYVALRNRSEQLEQEIASIHENPDATDEQLGSVMNEMRETHGKMREISRQERDVLLTQTAEALGYSGDDAAEIVTTIKEIYSSTDNGWGGFGGGRGGRGGRGGGRGGPRR